jgi:hypothetical protein
MQLGAFVDQARSNCSSGGPVGGLGTCSTTAPTSGRARSGRRSGTPGWRPGPCCRVREVERARQVVDPGRGRGGHRDLVSVRVQATGHGFTHRLLPYASAAPVGALLQPVVQIEAQDAIVEREAGLHRALTRGQITMMGLGGRSAPINRAILQGIGGEALCGPQSGLD